MSLKNSAEQTYSFGTGEIVQIMHELVGLLTGMGVDIKNGDELKAGFEKLFNIEYIDLPDLDERDYIFAANHVSDFDALILGLLHRRVRILSKSDWVDNEKLMGFLRLNYDLIGIDRASKVSQARSLVELAKYLCDATQVGHVLIFPQGTISDVNNNSVERVQPGIFALSNKAGVPVLPIFSEQPNFNHPTRIVFGKPMEIPGRRDDCRELWLNEVLALQNSLSPPARRPVLTEKHANNNKPGDPFF